MSTEPGREKGATGGSTNGTPADLRAAGPEQTCSNLIGQLEQLRAEVRELQAERDALRKAVFALLDKYEPCPEYTREELFASIGQGPSMEELIREIERELGG